MKKILLLCTLLICFLSVGCAKMPSKFDYEILDQAETVVPDDTHAVVYFMREKAFTGGAISYYIHHNKDVVGLLRSGSYFAIKTEPGEQTFWAETEAKAFTSLKAEPNKVYYVLGSVQMGVLAARPNLQVVNKDVAEMFLPELKYTIIRSKEESAAIRKAYYYNKRRRD